MTMTTEELIAEVIALPVEERALAVDTLLRSLNPPDADVDRKWAAVARQRWSDLRSGNARSLPGDEVFGRIWRRFSA
jgi:hypothetical protein